MSDETQLTMAHPRSRAWWVGTIAILLCLYAVYWLPGLVMTFEWPTGQIGNLLFFGPQYFFPFALTHVGPMGQRLTEGFGIDIGVWVVIAICVGLLTQRMRGWTAAGIALLTILGSTVILHIIISMLGWTFFLDGP